MEIKKLIKIIALVCIVLVIAGIWIFKNIDTDSETPGTSPISSESSVLVTPKNDGDFILETESVNLEALTAHGLPIIIDFGSDSCIPCKKMSPVLKTMNAEMQGKAIIKFVDIGKHAEAADDFPIQVIPTQIFIKGDGTPYVPSDTIDIEFTMYSYNATGEHAFTAHQGGLTEDEMRAILADMGVTE